VVLPLAENFLSAIAAAAAVQAAPAVSLRAPGINPFAPSLTYNFFVGRLLAQLGAGGGWTLIWFNGLALLGIASAFRARGGRLLFLLAWLIIGPGLIVAYLYYRNEIFAMRYVLFALPAYLLLVARGLAAAAGWIERRLAGPAASAVALAALAGFAWLDVQDLAGYYRTPKDDWRRIGAFLAANVRPGDAIYAPNVQAFVEFYFPAAPEFLVYEDGKREAQYTYGQHDRTWFVVSDWVTDDITDTRRLVDLLPGVRFQWAETAFVKFTHRGRSEAEIAQEAETFSIPPPSLAERTLH
jgi:hypothetical protein